MVVDQGSKVLSPAILSALPRKGTSIGAMLEGGIVVALQRNLRFVRSPTGTVPERLTSKREARAPPPLNTEAKSESLNAIKTNLHDYPADWAGTTLTAAPAVLVEPVAAAVS